MRACPWIVVLFVILSGCSDEKSAQPTGESSGSDRPLVYVTNYPLKYFSERISAPLVDVRFPVPSGEDPTFWKPTVDEVLALQQADLVMLNGASYEPWLKNVSLSPSKLVVTSATFKDRLIPMQDMATHRHGLKGEHEHSDTAFTTWLDLTLAIEQARAIKDALSARWPEHTSHFDAQFNELAKELTVLDSEIQQVVAGNPNLPVVFSHPVYQYFQARYAVNGRSVHWEPDEIPSDAMWQELVDLIKEHPAEFIIWERAPLPETAARLKTMGIGCAVLEPCAGKPAQDDFFGVMARNVASLSSVFVR